MGAERLIAVKRRAFLGARVEAHLADVLCASQQVVLLASRSAAEDQVARLERAAERSFVRVIRPAPTIDRTELDRLQQELDALEPDAVVAFGGGSIMDAGKALARPRPLLVLVPSTLSGSEHTGNVGWWDNGHKVAVHLGLADAVVADPTLLVDRLELLGAGALHAFAHVLATLTQTDPAREPGPREIVAAATGDLLGGLATMRTDGEARRRLQRGAWNAAVGFALTGPKIGAHHFLVHRLSGTGDHARLSARLLCATLLRTTVYESTLRGISATIAATADELAHAWAPLVAGPLPDVDPVRADLPPALATEAAAMLAALEAA